MGFDSMASHVQESRSVLAALVLGSLATGQDADAQNLTGSLPGRRPENSVAAEAVREFSRADVGNLSSRKDELDSICGVGGNGSIFVRCDRAREILAMVLKDLSRQSSVTISAADAQLVQSVLEALPNLSNEWRNIRRSEQEHEQLFYVADSSDAPSWLVVSCEAGLLDVKNISARWRAGGEWKDLWNKLVDEYEPRKKLVAMWCSGRSALVAQSQFEPDEGERLASSFEGSLRSLKSDSEQLISRLRVGPIGETLSTFSIALSPLYGSAESLNLAYARLATDTTYRAQCFQDGRLETMMNTVQKGIYVFTAACALALAGMVFDGMRRGRDHARVFFSPRSRPNRELTAKEQERIHRGW
jgi:hypothetical protein